MKITKYKCPECDAPLPTTDESGILKCEHCGAKMYIDMEENQLFKLAEKLIDSKIEKDRFQYIQKEKKSTFYILILVGLFIFLMVLMLISVYH